MRFEEGTWVAFSSGVMRNVVTIAALLLALVARTGDASAQGCLGDAPVGLLSLGTAIEQALAASTTKLTAASKEPAKTFTTLVYSRIKGGSDPYGYDGDTSDGCYARAYGICYDISTGKYGTLPAGCELQTVYVFWQNKRWRYHTACSVKCADGAYVLDGLNAGAMTNDEWFAYWDPNKSLETKDGVWFGPYDTHGRPDAAKRKRAQRVIDEQKKKANP